MTTPNRALIIIDAQQEYFEGLLPIQHPARDTSITRIDEAVNAAEEAGVPVVLVQHTLPAEAPVFASGSPTWQNHLLVAAHEERASHRVRKQFSSVFADTDLEVWLREQGVDTITLVGYMTNNCVLASAAAAEPLGRSTRPSWRCCTRIGPPSPTPRPGPPPYTAARL